MTSVPVPFSVLIVAAGRGERLGGEIPKQYKDLAGQSVLRRTIACFEKIPGVAGVRVVIDPAHEAWYADSTRGADLLPPAKGGKSRKESVWNGLEEFSNLKDEDILLIHDAARPFLRPEDILNVVQCVKEGYSENPCAATLALPVTETLRREEGERIAGGGVDRGGVWMIQTPQAFRYGMLRRAHETAPPGSYTDDTSVVSAVGGVVRLVPGHRDNVKITTPEDWAWAMDHVLKSQGGSGFETRTASGFDVHTFTKERIKAAVRLCGVDIPAPFGLEGHSDADAGLHALTDALLGTLAAGDIGTHFPPSDPRWKGADSSVFVTYAVERIRAARGRIVHADVTVICETPKIGPHRISMQQATARVLGVAAHRVSIKATTTEGLGFTGRREGVAVQATVSVEYPRLDHDDPGHDPSHDPAFDPILTYA